MKDYGPDFDERWDRVDDWIEMAAAVYKVGEFETLKKWVTMEFFKLTIEDQIDVVSTLMEIYIEDDLRFMGRRP